MIKRIGQWLKKQYRRFRGTKNQTIEYWTCSTKHETIFPPTHTRIKRCSQCGEVLR